MNSFLKFLKPLYVAAFLIIIIECGQIISGANYVYPFQDTSEILKVSGLSLLILLFLSALVSVILSLTVKNEESTLLVPIEIFSAVAVLIFYVPLLMNPFFGSYFMLMTFFWNAYLGLIPVAIILFVAVLRVLSGKGFKRFFYMVTETLFKPALVISALAFIWIVLGLIGGDTTGRASFNDRSARTSAESKEPNVILITFDALSAKDMSLYGYPLKTTPFWEALAGESYVFERTIANYNRTTAGSTSILTGKRPWTHGVLHPGLFLRGAKKRENIATELNKHYAASIAPSYFTYIPTIGMANQFDHVSWHAVEFPGAVVALEKFYSLMLHTRKIEFALPVIRHSIFSSKEDHRGDSFSDAVELLKRHKDKPVFLWLHIWPPHDPFRAPKPFYGTFLDEPGFKVQESGFYRPSEQRKVEKTRLRYDENILFSDAALYEFVKALNTEGLYDNSMLIITADHGESFEKGWVGHTSPFLMESEVHIPLLIHMPGQKEGRRLGVLSEQADIAPTILELAGRPVPEWMEGESLVPYIKGVKSETERTKFSMVFLSNYDNADHREKTVAAYNGDYKLIYDMTTESLKLFNLAKDPFEAYNIALKEVAVTKRLKKEIDKKMEGWEPGF